MVTAGAAAGVMPTVRQANNISKQAGQQQQGQQQPSNINSRQSGMSSASAFQPYKRQPDPFAGAPFDEPLTKPRLSTPEPAHTQPSKASMDTDRRRSKEKKTNANRSSTVQATARTSNELEIEDLDTANSNEDGEICQVIGNSTGRPPHASKFRTPSGSAAAKASSSKANPFINAPFTAKKNSTRPPPFLLDELDRPPPLVLPRSPELLSPPLPPKPEIAAKPSSSQIKTQQQQQPQPHPPPSRVNMARNLKSEINVSSSCLSPYTVGPW